MRRFLFLTFIGGLATLSGHASLSLGLHPERLVPLTAVLQGCSALAVGAALFVTGMLGVAEGYEKQSRRLAQLLRQRQTPDTQTPDSQAPAEDHLIDRASALAVNADQFWRGYLSTTGGLALALGGLFALVLILGDITYSSYRMTVGAGIAGIALPVFVLWARGMAGIRRSHTMIVDSARRVEALPEMVEVPVEMQRRPTRGAVFRSTRPAVGRDLSTKSRRSQAAPRPGERY